MIALIPARGGSKGLPGKNIRLLGGKPLIAWTIEAALECPEISRVIVSTDSQDIAGVALRYGAEVPFLRPTDLAADTSLAIDAYLHAIDWLEDDMGRVPEALTVLLPTSPLRTSADISAAIQLFQNKAADSVLSLTRETHPVSWHRFLGPDQQIGAAVIEGSLANRQSYEPTYYPNGAIYVLTPDLLKKRTYYSMRSYAYVMPASRSVDIDTPADFAYAEFLLSHYS